MVSRRPAASPHLSDVFSQLPSRLLRELDTAEVAEVLAELVAAGWRPGQLRYRVGAAPSQGSVEADAVAVLVLLRGLLQQTCPDTLHAREVQRRRAEPTSLDRAAEPAVAAQHLAQIRAQLPGLPRRRPEPAPRIRPACNLCDGEGAFFVTREVHLCRHCVALLAGGNARLRGTG